MTNQSERELVIEAGRTEREYWRDLWRYRELFWFLAWRDILVRYKQTVVGVAWAVIRPLLTMLVLVFLFRKVVGLPEDGTPYALTAFVGVLAWNFFSVSLQESGNSLVSNANLISKVYFPRLVVPAATVVTTFVDFLISGALLALLMGWYRYVPPPQIVALPLFVAMAFIGAVGCGLWLSALMVRYRDVRFIVPFIVQFGLFVSPVGIKTATVPEQWRLLYSLNPVVGVIDGFRWSILDRANAIYGPGMAVSAGVIAVIFVSGLWYFRRTERSFADLI